MQSEVRLYLSRWLAHPTRVVSPHPSSARLSALVAAKAIRSEEETVLEVGAGTGAVSRAMVAAGLQQKRLAMIELDAAMCEHLRSEFPEATVLQGDARRPAALVPPVWEGRITSCVSGIPLLHWDLRQQRSFLEQIFSLMPGEPRLVQYSNSPRPPLPTRELGLQAQRLGFAWSGVFPHYVWEFRPA